MFQSFLGYSDIDGVYWTLVYEVSFYIAICILLICSLQNKLESILISWPFLMGIAMLFGMQNIPFLGGYYSFFAAGSLFAILKERKCSLSILSLGISFALCILFTIKMLHYIIIFV
jgi:peptidoglycan/LPS O-acetylase OafA/YrhL